MADATSAALGDPLLPAGAGAGAALNTAALARATTAVNSNRGHAILSAVIAPS